MLFPKLIEEDFVAVKKGQNNRDKRDVVLVVYSVTLRTPSTGCFASRDGSKKQEHGCHKYVMLVLGTDTPANG